MIPPAGPGGPFDPFAWWAQSEPDRVALVDGTHGRRWSFGEIDAEIARWVGWLAGQGLDAGSRVAVLSGNCAEQLFLTFACGRLGLVIAPLNWRLAAAELRDVLARFRPAILIGEASKRSLTVGTPWTWHDLHADVAPAVAATDALRASDGPEATAPWIVLFTSGTTGVPKGAILPHAQIYWNAVATVEGWGIRPDDCAPVTTPFFHTGGLNVLSAPLWHCGGSVVLLDRFDPETFRGVLERESCTLAFAVPTQYVMLLEHGDWDVRVPSLRLLVSGGAACAPAVAMRVAAPGYTFREGFGLTEFGPNCFTGSDAALHGEVGVVGDPLPHVEAQLCDPLGQHVARGEVGELWLRGPMAFAGYLDDPGRTAETLQEGWVRTGDLFVQDAAGRFAVRGRRKEMYISGGENIFPAEVEAVLAQHPAVAEVSVVGVPDQQWGEVGRAYVTWRHANTTGEDLMAFARERLARYKVPKSVITLAAMPRLGNGKVDRTALVNRSGAT